MPKDKDFKRLVRSRMARTGERYTVARAGLRPRGSAPGPVGGPGPAMRMPPTVVPLDYEALLDLRAGTNLRRGKRSSEVHRPHPGPRWELKVLAAEPLADQDSASIALSAVAALGTALGGVGYLALGLDALLSLPGGVEAGSERFPPIGPVIEAEAELLTVVRDKGGLEVPSSGDGRRLTGHKMLQRADAQGVNWLEAWIETGLLIEPGERTVVDLAAILEVSGALPGRVWVGYGVVAVIDREFPQQPLTHGEGGLSTPITRIERGFWDQAGAALESAAESVGLPSWSLEDGWLRCLSTSATYGARYRPRWGHFQPQR